MDEKEWQAHKEKVNQEHEALRRAEEDYEDDEEYADFDEDDAEWDESEFSRKCSCVFCFCTNDTEYGEVCNDCLAGIHQG